MTGRSLRPKAGHVMTALSGWALPRGQSVELNRDEYCRPALKERAERTRCCMGLMRFRLRRCG